MRTGERKNKKLLQKNSNLVHFREQNSFFFKVDFWWSINRKKNSWFQPGWTFHANPGPTGLGKGINYKFESLEHSWIIIEIEYFPQKLISD